MMMMIAAIAAIVQSFSGIFFKIDRTASKYSHFTCEIISTIIHPDTIHPNPPTLSGPPIAYGATSVFDVLYCTKVNFMHNFEISFFFFKSVTLLEHRNCCQYMSICVLKYGRIEIHT